MDNYFLQNPIKFNILQLEEDSIIIKYKIICLSNIPDNIKKNILNFNKNTSPSILKKYYGASWNTKLELIDKKSGGNNDEEIMTSEDLINFDDFHLHLLDKEDIVEDDSLIIESQNIDKKHKIERDIIYNTDIIFYPNDNIKILREKIFLITKINIYEQNISLHNYTIILDKLKYDISFNNIFKLNKVKNIPIDNYLYENKNDILIYGYEYEYLNTFFKEYGKLEIDVLSLTEFIPDKIDLQKIVKSDKQQTDMIYYSFILKYFPLMSYEVFKNYILYYEDMSSIYPTLFLNYQDIKKKYDIENNIYKKNNEINENEYKKFIQDEFSSSIIGREFLIKSLNKLNKINIRNLFDNIEIKSIKCINYIKANIYIDDKEILLTKINNKTTELQKDELDIDSMLFNIKIIYKKFNISENDKIYISLIINNIGDIILKTSFQNLFEINNKKLFELIDEIINPIIKDINKKLIKTDNILTPITKYNNIIKNSIIHIYWNNEISIKGFNVLLLKLKEYVDAGIINIKHENLVNNEIEYNINKGMVNFNEKNINKYIVNNENYFLYYSNGDIKVFWNRIYTNSKTILIKNKLNNLKLELNNITEIEVEYISQLLYKFLLLNKKEILIKDDDSKATSLKFLKQKDPKLYTIKDPKTGKDIYSRKCQKKLQPIIISKSEITDENKDNVLKFWNFTKNKDEYYSCPNKSFPFVKFLTNIHPDNYCVPCCKKKDMADLDENSKSKIAYDSCIKNHIYDIKESESDKSRYIMTYGKELEINRIMTLPNELQTIINTNIEKLLEQYYLYGINQAGPNIHNIGILYILSNIYDLTLIEYIKKVAIFLKDNGNIFSYLLNGRIIYHFSDVTNLITTICNIFIYNKLVDNTFDLWNSLFIDISHYMGINIIIFKDIGSIEITIPKNTKYITDIFSNNINSKYLIIIEKEINIKDKLFYPIYFINPKQHFKEQIITKKIFNNEDAIINNLKKVYNYYLSQNSVKQNIFDLYMLYKFLDYHNLNNKQKYSIYKYYINNKKKCYGALIKYDTKYFYISLHESIIDLDNIEIKDKLIFNILDLKSIQINIKIIFDFIKNYNIFIYNLLETENIFDSETNKMLLYDIKMYNKDSVNSFNFDIISEYKYKFLRISKFILFEKKIIGIICNDLYFYINPSITTDISLNIIKTNISSIKQSIFSVKDDLKAILIRIFNLNNKHTSDDLNSLYIKNILYHPQYINGLIINNKKDIKDIRIIKKNKSLYNTYIYPLILLQFQKEFSTYQNIKLRSIIKNSINNLKTNELLTKYFKTSDNKIFNVMDKYFSNLTKKSIDYKDDLCISYNDIHRIIIFYLNKNISNHKDLKKSILDEIDNNKFQFDKIYLTKFKLMTKKELISELHNISKKLFIIKEKDNFIKDDFEFPNILLPCKEDSSADFCDKDKLIISKQNLDMYLIILAGDIHNPIKSQYIFSAFFVNNNVNLFTFKNYPSEKIFIS